MALGHMRRSLYAQYTFNRRCYGFFKSKKIKRSLRYFNLFILANNSKLMRVVYNSYQTITLVNYIKVLLRTLRIVKAYGGLSPEVGKALISIRSNRANRLPQSYTVRPATHNLLKFFYTICEHIVPRSGNGAHGFDYSSSVANFFKIYKTSYSTFLRYKKLNTNALFTSLWGRRHRNKISLGGYCKQPNISRERRLYFYLKTLPRLKHKIRKRKPRNMYKRLLAFNKSYSSGLLQLRLWRTAAVLSLNY